MNECMFTTPQLKIKIRATLNAEEHKSAIDEPFERIADDLQHESSRMCNSVEVHDLYVSYNGVSLSRRQLVKSLIVRFGEDLLVLLGNDVTSILVFKSKAAGHLKIVSNDDDDDVDIVLRRVASNIVTESKQLKRNQTKYEPESLCRTVSLQAAKHVSASCKPSHLD